MVLIFRLLVISGVLLVPPTVLSQDAGEGPASRPVVEKILVGAHPTSTRILVFLNQRAEYSVIPDFQEKRVGLVIADSVAGENLRARAFPDRNLQRIEVTPASQGVEVSFVLKHLNTQLFHHLQTNPLAIVLDFKGRSGPPLKVRSRKKAAAATKGSQAVSPPPGKTEAEIRRLVAQDAERKIVQGWEEYTKALKLYQGIDPSPPQEDEKAPKKRRFNSQKDFYAAAVKAFDAFQKKFPESPYLSPVLYLKAEALFNIHVQGVVYPDYEKVIDAYQLAMRTFPDSKFFDHALLKLGSLFDTMDLPLEAGTFYNYGLKKNPGSLYNPDRQIGLARMFLRERRYDEAFRAFEAVLNVKSKNRDAKAGIFKIGQILFEQGKFSQAREIYESGAQQWPEELITNPQIHYFMGEIYFMVHDHEKARRHFFDLLNLDPASRTAHLGLNHIGDTYLIGGNSREALSIFERSQKMHPESAESQYAKIRLADLGVRDPTLPLPDLIFDIPAYFQPLKTYDTIFRNAKTQDILAEVTLSRGTAHLIQKRYLRAINEFKKLLALEPRSRFHKKAVNFLKQALVLLIDHYADQQGALPILYAYSDFRALNIGHIKMVETLLHVGESYQAIGMVREALAYYERVKQADPNEMFRDRLFLNLGRIHLDQGNFGEAEVISRTFLTQYPLSPHLAEGLKMLGQALKGQKQYSAARNVWQKLLAREDTDPAEVHYLLAETWFAQGDSKKAVQEYALTLDTYDRTLTQVADHVKKAYYKLGIMLYQDGQHQRALQALTAARQLFPEHRLRGWADYLIADSYERMNNKVRAAQEFEKIIASPPKEGLIRQAAEIGIKVLDWERRLKEKL